MMVTCRISFDRLRRGRAAVFGGLILLSGAGCSKGAPPQPGEGEPKPPGSPDGFYDHRQFEIKVQKQMVGTFERYNRAAEYDKLTLPGEKPFETAVLWNKISQDGADWAVVHGAGAIINGKKVLLPEAPETPHAFQFLAGGSWVYVGDRRVVVGTEMGPQFDAINGLAVQPHSASVAYVARQGAETLLVHNGKRQPVIGAVETRSLRLSPDGKRSAYVAVRGGKEIAVVDGKEVPFGDKTILFRQIFFSPDSKRFVFVATDGVTCAAVVDGRPDDPVTQVLPHFFTFSPDGRQYAYVASGKGRPKVILNGREVAASFPTPVFTFSPDGRHFAYVESASDPASECVVIDGKRGAAFESVVRREPYEALDAGGKLMQQVFTSIIFSPDSKRHAYCVKKGAGQAVVVDGQVGPVFDRILWSRSLGCFSGSGQGFVYAAIRDGQTIVVDNGRERGPYPGLGANDIVVSHNGEHVAFVVSEQDPKDAKKRLEHVVVDGTAGASSRYIAKDSLILSPCGKHHAYVSQPIDDENAFALIVDGKEAGRIENPAVFDVIGKAYDELRPLPQWAQEPGLRFPVFDKSGVARYEELPGRWQSRPGTRVKRPEPYHFSLSDYKIYYRTVDRKLTVWGFHGASDLTRYDVEIAPQP